MRLLVIATTFPSSDTDPVPAFVKEQLIAFKKIDPKLEISVLAPHDARSHTQSFTKHQYYDEYRFHYAWPHTLEKLAGRGIMPALKKNPLNYLLIPFLFMGEFVALLRLTKKLQPDVLYAHWFTPQAVTARYVGALTKTDFVFTTHAADVDVWNKIPLIGKWIVRSNVSKAKAFTAVSSRSMHKVEQFFSPAQWKALKSRAKIIPMGLTLPEQVSPPKQKGATTKTITFVGRLTEKKGVQYLLPAYKQILEHHKNSKLVIAGDGPMRSELEAQARQLGVNEHVSFSGYVSGKRKDEVMRNTDIYVVPSIITKSGDAEGLPVSLMEGLSYSKICIATNESGADDILSNGIDGFLIPQQDINALVDTISQCLNLSKAREDAIRAAAQVTAEQFSWPIIAKRHLEHFSEENEGY